MSRDVAALVYSRQVGSMARKAVLAYMAERANDDGSGVWASKQRIADEVECSKQTVITTIRSLTADGLIEEVGQRRTTNGYTLIYDLRIDRIAALPKAKRDAGEVQICTGQKLDPSNHLTPRGQTALPKPSYNRPIPSEDKSSSGERARERPAKFRSKDYHRLPDGWVPNRPLPPNLASRLNDWSQVDFEGELEIFRGWAANADDVRGKGRKLDWDAAWANWLNRAADQRPITRSSGRESNSLLAAVVGRGGTIVDSIRDPVLRAMARKGQGGGSENLLAEEFSRLTRPRADPHVIDLEASFQSWGGAS